MTRYLRFARTSLSLAVAAGALIAPAVRGEVGVGDASALDTLRRNVVAELVRDASASDATEARRHLDNLEEDGLWTDVDYKDNTPGPWKAQAHLARLSVMARAFRTSDSPLRGDKALLTGILKALDVWLARDPQNPNWWHNQISVPRMVGQTMLLLGDAAPEETRRHAIAILSRSDWITKLGARSVEWTGANLVDMAGNRIMRGLLEGNEDMVRDAFQRTYGEIRIVPPGDEGIQQDLSFHQHGSLLYNGGYGEVFVGAVGRIMRIGRGTPFTAPEDRRDLLLRHILDGTQWMTWGRHFDYGTLGRGISRANRHAGGYADVLDNLVEVAGPRAAELRGLARRLRGENVAPLSGNRHFWNSDFMVHHRPGWYASARGYSTRLYNTDGAHNREGRTSHHIADGANFLFRTGEEYHDIFPAWDWRKVPGTTVVQDKAPLDVKAMLRKSTTTFVGGVSDGTYGMAAMDLEREGLTAKKAWFFFDDEYVCLGAGIKAPPGRMAMTTVEQRRLSGAVHAEGLSSPLQPGRTSVNGRWILHDGAGYLFAPGTRPRLETGTRSGRWSDIGTGSDALVTVNVFTLWLEHKTDDQDAEYVYTVIPKADARSLVARVGADPVGVLSNTPRVQAVEHSGLAMLQAAFREKATLTANGWTLRVDKPCLMMARRIGSAWRVAASNPNNQPLTLNVSLKREGSEEIKLRFELPGGPDAGRSVVQEIPDEPRP